VNGVGDFASSIIAGALWTALSYGWSFMYGAILAIIAIGILLIQNRTHRAIQVS
jgi:predicted MFS family arabinose efflux permease